MRMLPKEFSLVSLGAQDVRKIVDFQNAEKFNDGWNENMLKSSFEGGNFLCLAVMDKQNVLGFITATLSVDTADIEDILVGSEYKRMGLASVLIEQALKIIKATGKNRVLLEVRQSNLPAINLYTKLGFSEVRIRKAYYNGSENAIVMAKELL